MPHIDEGTLHALLDGAIRAMEPERADAVEAHLRVCAECRARADQAAMLRGRAGEILGVLEPAVTPDFDEVLVRAGAGRTTLRRQLRWTRGAAWAATIVIALGTGYLVRDLVGPDGAMSAGPRSAAEAPQEESAGADAPLAQEAPREGSSATSRLADAAEPAPEREPAAAPIRADPAERRALPLTLTEVAPADGAEALAAGDPGVPEPRVEMAASAAEESVEESTGAMAGARVAGRAAGPLADGQADFVVYEAVAPEAVQRAVGAPLMVLPGAEVVQTLVARGGGGVAIEIVSLQRLEDGVEIRVTQRPATVALDEIVVTGQAADAPAAPAAPAPERRSAERERLRAAPPALPETEAASAANTVTAPAGWIGWELVLLGPLPEDALRTLAAAARPYAAPR